MNIRFFPGDGPRSLQTGLDFLLFLFGFLLLFNVFALLLFWDIVLFSVLPLCATGKTLCMS